MSLKMFGYLVVLQFCLAAAFWFRHRGPVVPQGPSGAVSTAAASCPDEADSRVLAKLMPEFQLSCNPTLKEIDRDTVRLNCVRDWANGLTDQCVRKAYIGWLAFFEVEYLRARLSITVSGYSPEFAASEDSREYDGGMPAVPSPPASCDRGKEVK